MIIDAFIFFNELDILELRLNILYPYVDKFILVESNKTTTYINKPFHFEENKERFAPFLDKIVHVKMEETNIKKDTWSLEYLQRNFILKGLGQIKINEKDIVIISDVDEIWNPKYLETIKQQLEIKNFVSIDMDYLVFALNLETVNKRWIGPVFTYASNLIHATPQGVRNIKDRVFNIPNAGWHFGYQGGKKMVYLKYFSCVEPIDKSLIPSEEKFYEEFDNRIKDGGSFIFSDNLENKSIKLKKYDNSKLPDYIINNIDKYKSMMVI